MNGNAASHSTSRSNATSVPGSRQTATVGSPIAAKPRVGEVRNRVETSLSPTRAGRDATKWRLESHMINNSLLLRTAGNHPLIQVRERSAWVRDFPDVPRSCLDASGIPDWWKAGICVREIAAGVGPVVGSSTAGRSSRALPVHHEGDPRVLLRIEAY